MELNKTHYHEAAHLVFNRLIHYLEINFPTPTYVLVENDGNGKIDGGWLTHANNEEGNKQLGYLREMPTQNTIAQLFYLMAGYASHPVFYNGEKEVNFYTEQGLKKTDYIKCDKITSLITGDSNTPNWAMNKKNKAFLITIEKDVIEIIQRKEVRDAIEYAAKEINKQGDDVRGESLTNLIQELDCKLSKVNIYDIIDKHSKIADNLNKKH